ncbi:MAG: DUF2953 domain-containing protein [Ruminococcaceae bacterium]|nr:DUF2953 domain-containing protein [Oscillospiraceae bacterium]
MWWLIPLILLLLIILLLHLRIRLCIIYNEDLDVHLKLLFFNIPIFPKKQKKPKAKDYSIKKLRKKQKKIEKKNAKKELKKQKKQTEQPANKDRKKQITEILELIKIVLEYVMPPFGKYFRLEILKLNIKIGSSDPSKTAVTYGLVSQSVAYIIELLSNITNVDVKKHNGINVYADFMSEKSNAEINIILNLKVWHSLFLAFKFFMGFLKRRSQKTTQEN